MYVTMGDVAGIQVDLSVVVAGSCQAPSCMDPITLLGHL